MRSHTDGIAPMVLPPALTAAANVAAKRCLDTARAGPLTCGSVMPAVSRRRAENTSASRTVVPAECTSFCSTSARCLAPGNAHEAAHAIAGAGMQHPAAGPALEPARAHTAMAMLAITEW